MSDPPGVDRALPARIAQAERGRRAASAVTCVERRDKSFRAVALRARSVGEQHVSRTDSAGSCAATARLPPEPGVQGDADAVAHGTPIDNENRPLRDR
jgi:hypothetical protein